ncbi:hypothetical protein [Pseudomonas fluorescens]|uniref:Lipoprotein n=2 Tax=Pseudomonas fluorescens TaxID=294 RepID=A0ABY1TFJ7_PSEFL|nr:hypothetical protein [Pseudomonas fluorescens]MCI4605855.1 hypothetical protein [Pseudomonas fluorescens]NNB72103.1 hypothetical protein [Pseudomonas fluorescens]PQB01775.1 hypothetical protein B0A76_05990 [Pseudomonas fluorescens]RFP95106.1 hypothetical protein D0N73_16390 [Pseudomonas fluorescens]TWR43461.1 hypothetical protein FIP59_28735 [Pseudomonas fluorescens]
MSRWVRSVWLALGIGWLSGCAVGPVDRFTLEVDLPAQFRFIGAANYRPARGQICRLPERRGKRPERKIFIAHYKPVAERVSYDLPLTETIEGCPSVLRSVEFSFYAKWGARDTDVGGDFGTIYFTDPIESEGVAGMPESGVQELPGQCQWFFRTVGPLHVIRKIMQCRSLDAMGQRQKSLAGGVVQRDPLVGKKLRLTLTVTDEEEPAFDRRWIAVPGGWKRCRGKSFEDLVGVCGRNILEFKPITMPDGRTCDVYPTCN